jgi:hypothetical protein
MHLQHMDPQILMSWHLWPTAGDDVPVGDDLLPVAPKWWWRCTPRLRWLGADWTHDGGWPRGGRVGRVETKWIAGRRWSGWTRRGGVGAGRRYAAQDGCMRRGWRSERPGAGLGRAVAAWGSWAHAARVGMAMVANRVDRAGIFFFLEEWVTLGGMGERDEWLSGWPRRLAEWVTRCPDGGGRPWWSIIVS